MNKNGNLMDKIVSLAKRRGFIFPGSEIYGGMANSWDYGPLGVELKNNVKNLWWDKFVHRRGDIVGIDAALIMNPKVWEKSGHLKEFSDPLVECKKCHERYRLDHIEEVPSQELDASGKSKIKKPCPKCGAEDFTEARQFNLMFKTFIGPAEEQANVAYLRPETAQAMFVDFKNVLSTSRAQVPFGIAQAGKAFRNEITPGNFIYRTREFEQMEIEYFVKENEWEKWFEHWRAEMEEWMFGDLGLKKEHIHEHEIPDGERAHYSKRTIDFEYDYPFGQKELYGLAYRTDFDLRNHFDEPPYRDAFSGETFWPHVIEPTWGVDRSVLAVLLDSYTEEDGRIFLKLPNKLAPYKVAVFPLLANKPQLVQEAKKIYSALKKYFVASLDDRGNIGKRYYAQDEIGTPYCVTVDFDSLENGDVTIRDRDTAKQERIKISDIKKYLDDKLSK